MQPQFQGCKGTRQEPRYRRVRGRDTGGSYCAYLKVDQEGKRFLKQERIKQCKAKIEREATVLVAFRSWSVFGHRASLGLDRPGC